MFYNFAIVFVRIILLFCFRVRREGIENIPAEGGVILAVKHRSNLDPVMAGITCPRRLTFMAKSELFKNPLFGRLITALGAFPVHRGKGDIGAVKSAFSILKSGRVMLIFPEGRRVKKNEISKAQPGVAMIAQHTKAPVIPVYIDGDYKWMHKITVRYGEPIKLDEYYGKKLSIDELREVSGEILDKINGLKKQ